MKYIQNVKYFEKIKQNTHYAFKEHSFFLTLKYTRKLISVLFVIEPKYQNFSRSAKNEKIRVNLISRMTKILHFEGIKFRGRPPKIRKIYSFKVFQINPLSHMSL